LCPQRLAMNHRFLSYSLLLTALQFISAGSLAQKIENVRPEVSEDKIHIYYDLVGIPATQAVIVQIYVSTDGGTSYGDPLKSVNGDVGLVMGSGENRRITWDVFEEADELISESVKFKVKADLFQALEGRRLSKPGYLLNVSAGLGSRVKLSSYGFDMKAAIYLNQLGLGVRGSYYKTYGEDPMNGFTHYWGFSGGAVIEYDFLRNQKYSLYPFLYLGQTKILHVPVNPDSEYFAYSIFYSPGVGFNARIFKFIYLGLELEYMMAPRIDIMEGGSSTVNENIILDGFNLGIVLKFVRHPH
jgi:hypothetical protein